MESDNDNVSLCPEVDKIPRAASPISITNQNNIKLRHSCEIDKVPILSSILGAYCQYCEVDKIPTDCNNLQSPLSCEVDEVPTEP